MMSELVIWIRTIIIYTFPAVTLICVIANSLSFLIFSHKRFHNTIFSTYFRFYLLFEILNQILPINKMFELNLEMYFSLISNFSCKLRKYFAYSDHSITAWFMMIISFDRYLSIGYPTKFLIRKNKMFQIIASCFIIGYNCCFYIPFLFFYIKESKTNRTNQTIITYKCISPGLWVEFLNLIHELSIPFSFMFLFTLLTIRIVFKSRRSSLNNSSKSKDLKFAISSITMNVLFLLFNSPYFIFIIMNDYFDLFANQIILFKLLNSIINFFFYINSTMTFFVNYFFNSMFKKEFNDLFILSNNNNANSS